MLPETKILLKADTVAQGRDYNRCAVGSASISYVFVEPTIRDAIRSPTANEINSAARVWEILSQDYDSAFTTIGRRIHLEPTRCSPGIGRKQRSNLGNHRRLPPSFRAVPRSFDTIVGVFKYNPSGELRARLVMTELLRHPTPELTHALGELMYALGDAGVATAPHTGAAVHSQRCV